MSVLQNIIENNLMSVFYSLFVTLRRPREATNREVDMSKFELTFEDDFRPTSSTAQNGALITSE